MYNSRSGLDPRWVLIHVHASLDGYWHAPCPKLERTPSSMYLECSQTSDSFHVHPPIRSRRRGCYLLYLSSECRTHASVSPVEKG